MNLIAVETPSSPDAEQATALVGEWVSIIEDLRGELDTSQYELEGTLERLDYDATAIVEFVREEVAFQSYAGSMRGAEGTLRTRAGNALDQSILLARLLNDAGFEARIQRGTLSRDQAAALVASSSSPSTRQLSPFRQTAGDVFVRWLSFVGKLQKLGLAGPPPAGSFNLAESTALSQKVSERLVGSLDGAGIDLQLAPLPEAMVQEATPYFWVQYRDTASAPWMNVHPVTPDDAAVPAGLQATETLVGQVPGEWLQKIQVQAFAKRRLGSREEVVALMDPWQRPVANLADEAVVYRHASDAMLDEVSGEASSASGLFFVMLGDDLAPGSKAFSLNGDIAPADVALTNMAGVFKTVGSKGASAASALSSLGNAPGQPAQKAMALEDVWFEVRLSRPGHDEDKVWRRSFRSLAGAGPVTLESLQDRLSLSLQFGPVVPALAYDRMLKLHAMTLRAALDRQRRAMNASGASVLTPEPGALDFSVFDRHTLFSGLLQLAAEPAPGVTTYRPEPLIAVSHTPQLAAAGQAYGLDILNNARRSLARSASGETALEPAATMRAGVWEAISEDAAIRAESDAVHSAIALFRERLSGPPWLVARPSSDDLTGIGFGAEQAVRLAQSASDAELIVLPAGPAKIDAWWQVSPGTGETLGVTDNGWGGSYFFAFGVETTESLAQRKIAAALTCMVVANAGCRSFAKLVRAEMGVLAAFGVDQACDAIIAFLSGGGALPPGLPSCSDTGLAQYGLDALLDKFEKAAYEQCFKKYISECGKAAVR